MRASWDSYFLAIAEQVSTRGTCDRKRVGCLIVKDRNIVSSGFNGSISGHAHCDDVGHDMVDGHCVRTVHAELNAIAQAARRGIAVDGATLYCNTYPCWGCAKVLVNAGIVRIVVSDEYGICDRVSDLRIVEVLPRV